MLSCEIPSGEDTKKALICFYYWRFSRYAFSYQETGDISESFHEMKFYKMGRKSLTSLFRNWFLGTYFAISHDPLDQSNSLSHVSRK